MTARRGAVLGDGSRRRSGSGERARACVSTAVFALLVLGTRRAEAHSPDASKDQCIADNSQAQTHVRAGQFAAARAELLACAAPACPMLVQDDCTQRLEDLERAQPTMVFAATDPKGNDLADVKVLLDGATLATRLDGTALRVDPGLHEFVFEAAGCLPVTAKIIVSAGQKDQLLRVKLDPSAPEAPRDAAPVSAAPPDAATSAPKPGPVDEGPPPKGGTNAVSGIGIAALGLSAGALLVGSVFGLEAISDWSSARSECGSAAACPNRTQAVSDHDKASTEAAISTVAFVTGGVLAVAGPLLVLVGRHKDSPPTYAVSPVFGPGGGMLTVIGDF